ncbi:hypothetical protein FDI21_gp014 [Pseudomonas phage Noxifer]|uniref:Uncharacterized protein n=1 Tax=Pseudomonas phage Noxifer TaxID=2006684 RepID=A0A1Y0SXD1_9CAUD|nr:hypothetical protein FDI21_gp014 [Pseudomonas phage Noxifer]ARV77185.1 hypothetical protein NOXIFER_14 [Pseudomonas phage Noxifer]
MTLPKHALDKLENALFFHYPVPTHANHEDAEIDTAKLQVMLTQLGLSTLVDYDKVVCAYFYPGFDTTKVTCAQVGIVTDTSYFHVSADHELFRHVLVERWPLVMDQATYHLYASHSKNPNQLVSWPSSQTKFYLSHVGYSNMKWTNDEDDSGLQVELVREQAVHLAETMILLTERDKEEEA